MTGYTRSDRASVEQFPQGAATKSRVRGSVPGFKTDIRWKITMISPKTTGFMKNFFQITMCCVVMVTAGYGQVPLPTNNDPGNQIRFATKEEADDRRDKLIRFIWPDGLPANLMPEVTEDVGSVELSDHLALVDKSLVRQVDRLELEPLGIHSLMFLLHPSNSETSSRLAIVHAGHTGGGIYLNDSYLSSIEFFLRRGYAVVMIHMPLFGWNTSDDLATLPNGAEVSVSESGHAGIINLVQHDTALSAGAGFRVFLEPTIAAINHWATIDDGAPDVTMIGLSGGGWTTHLAAALDTRIGLNFPVAGSYPLYLRNISKYAGSVGDLEQYYEPLYNEDIAPDGSGGGVATWLEIYALGGYGKGRRQIMVTAKYDDCCFNGDPETTVNTFVPVVARAVRKLGEGQWEHHLDTTHRTHQISPWVLEAVVAPNLPFNGQSMGAAAPGITAPCPECTVHGGDHPSATREYLNDLYDVDKRAFRCTAANEDEFYAWQARARVEFNELLGLPTIAKDNEGHQPVVELEGEIIDEGTYTRRKGYILTERHVRIPFWLLKPRGEGPFPLAITPHGHSDKGWEEYAGVKSFKPDYNVAVQAANRGFLAIAPATRGIAAGDFSIGDVTGRHGNKDCVCHNWQANMAGRTAMGERVWDMMKLLDWALALPEVDGQTVLMMGNSGGGRVTLHAAAVDTRITMAISSCAYNNYISFTGSMRFCPCNTLPGIIRFGEAWDAAALVAPRFLLTVSGKEDALHPVEEVDHAVKHLRALYGIAGAEGSYEHRYGEEGHRFYAALMWPWVTAVSGRE